ncbi:hypothetical protein [Dipodfec virus UA06Rod_21]|uniref:Uncharacterized protein n=1 Tax=Dipodfec virus UA06Rod_21 TaxID=2929321 RepID=A0A976N1L4_9VIRU|nr:hypothetical protein [Dipodfec virus UA06Rod_21]
MVELLKAVNSKTGEFLIKPKFNTGYRYVARKDAEINSGDYIVDDTDYMSLETLIARTKRENPRLYNDINSGGLADNIVLQPDQVEDYVKGLIDPDDEVETDTDIDISRPSVDENNAGDGSATPSQEPSNPALVDPVASATE